MGAFDGYDVDNAKPGASKDYLKPGTHYALIRNMKTDKRFSDDAQYFLAEFDVLKSSNEEQGATGSWCPLLRKDTPAIGDVRSLIASCYGAPIEQVNAAALNLAVDAKQPCKGKPVRIDVKPGKTKKGNDFSYHSFSPWSPTAEELAQLKAAKGL